ncbi:MAG: hypothetical protein O2894_06735 [Planctomycetota bacterium]|nr:hypothetical protein [Planctomycetota bacterium]
MNNPIPSLLRLALVPPLLLACAGPVWSEDDDALASKLEAIKQRIVELQQQAEAANAAGKADEAREYALKARDAARKLEDMVAKRETAGEGAAKSKRVKADRLKADRVKGEKQAKQPKKGSGSDHEQLAHDLWTGIQALERIGGHEELKRGMLELLDQVKHRMHEESKQGEPGSERAIVKKWLGVMGMAKKVLVRAERHDAAHVVEHGMHALELALEGRRDADAMKVRDAAPSRPEQARALFLAAEILADHGERKQAGAVAELAERFQGAGERGSREKSVERAEGQELSALRGRVETIRLAVPILREYEKRELAEHLERAIHTGELMLAERNDDEARAVYARTPSLAQLAEILHYASELWRKAGHGDRAERVGDLAAYYRQRHGANQQEEHAAGEREGPGEREERGEHGEHEDEQAEAMERLAAQMQALHAQLEAMQRQLKELRSRR